MADREKVIKGLEVHSKSMHLNFCDECPYKDSEEEDEEGNYEGDCVYCLTKDAIDLLKEQEPKTGHWIFESKYCEAWSHTCSECGKRMTTGVGIYASFCWNCGAKMTGGET